jgi:hypothetical protein
MKCLYFLSPDLVSTKKVSDDLHDVGIDDWFIHIISKDDAGLHREKLHSSNWLETRDLLRDGFIGANLGFIVGVIAAGLLMIFEPFGPELPNYIYGIVIAFATCFGAWEGGLFGIATQNKKIRRFSDAIDDGQFLVLIYAKKGQGEMVKQMMRQRHPEARHVATDREVYNPFSSTRRRAAN